VLRINKSYNLFFSNLKSRKANKTKRFVSPPSFKKSGKYKSFTLTQAGYEFLGGNKVRIGKKTFKFFKSRNIQGNPKTVTIKRDSVGDLWLIVTTDFQDTAPAERFKPSEGLNLSAINPRNGNSIGFDFGLKIFLTGSDSERFAGTCSARRGNLSGESPKFRKQGMRKIRKANQQVSRKKKGSNNRRKANQLWRVSIVKSPINAMTTTSNLRIT